MFDLSKFRQLSILSSIFLGFFITALSAIATTDVTKIRKLEQQRAIILKSSDTEKARSQQRADVRIEEVEPQTTSIFNSYNNIARVIKNLPSNGQLKNINAEDNNVRRLLKQQLNNSLEVYQIIGQVLEEGILSSDYEVLSFIDDFNLPFYQGVLIAISEINLVTNIEKKTIANNACLEIAKQGESKAQLRLEAGVGTRIDVLTARYLRRHCEIQRIELELGNSDIESNTIKDNIRESQSQSQQPKNLAESKLEIAEARQKYNLSNSLTNHYITNIELLQKLNSQGQSLKIHTDDSNLQKLYKQQLNDALELYRLIGLRLMTGIMNDDGNSGEIMLPAVSIALAEINLATQPNERVLASETCSKIAQAWEKDILAQRKITSKTRIRVLAVDYWKRQCNLQKL